MLEFAIGEAVFKIASDCRNTGFNFDKLSSKKLHNLIHGGHRQAVKASDCGSDMRGFESHCPPHLLNQPL